MEPITLDRRFRPWRYGVGHSQLLLHAHADSSHDEHINVIFEDVRAVKLRSSYHPLTLQPAEQDARASILAFAQVSARHQARFLCLTLPTPDAEHGFVACARATVLTTNASGPDAYTWNERSRLLYVLKQTRLP
ncbi:hypothetical protein ACSNN7_22555 [Micromonospora sp. URMC 105]|uniref:hypothetical protein n=1 Tax=Micromonospora sp. URMC 105 TaxID=3423413 RepID=UPI003F1BDCD4